MTPDGLPHSEISGSKAVCAYPKLIAAYHVLHRFPEPRHPPCALKCLTSTSRFPQKKTRKTKIPHSTDPPRQQPNIRPPHGKPAYVFTTTLACQRSIARKAQPRQHTRGREKPQKPLSCILNASIYRTVALYQINPRLLPPTAHNGEYRSRTGDLLLAKQVLSQLS